MDLEKVECFLQVALQPAVHVPVPVARLPGSAPARVGLFRVPLGPRPSLHPPMSRSVGSSSSQKAAELFLAGLLPVWKARFFGLTSLA
jgi:hypothetical protein